MRIAFIGDLQYATAEEENLAYKMDQIRALSPDLAIVMGDVGGSHMGSVEGLEETRDHVSRIGCDWAVILGNHDVEYSPSDPDVFDYRAAFCRVFPGKKLFTVIDRGGVLLICVSIERRPAEDFRTHNAVYVSDEQIDKIEEALRAHPGKPTVLVTHAPVAGSGLRRSLPLHCGATDTYLGQGFNAARWRELIAKYPQIRVCVSAHLHMSHEYLSAVTFRHGVTHVSCGAMTVCARDDIYQTRLMDVDPEKAIIYTLNHTSGELRRDAELDLGSRTPPRGNVASPRKNEMLIGRDRPHAVWRLPDHGRYYVATENGLLWEYECALEEFGGAIALDAGADALSVSGGRLYVSRFDGGVFSVDLNSTGRFDRIGGCVPQEKRPESGMAGTMLEKADFSVRGSKEGVYVIFDV